VRLRHGVSLWVSLHEQRTIAGMKKLTIVLNWICLAICLASVLMGAIRDMRSSGGINLLPFASALAVYHLKPRSWIAVIAFLINSIWQLGLSFFFYHSITQSGVLPTPSLQLWCASTTGVIVCSLNFVSIGSYIRRVPVRVAE
jgi:hypothetical protein